MHIGELARPTGEDYFDDVLAAVLPAGEVVEIARQMSLEPLPRLVSAARGFVTSQAACAHSETMDALELLTSELVTNAVIHARTALRVGVIMTADYVVVTVHDLDLGHTEISPELREGGRGLELVELLADAWDVHKDATGGKTVWFRLRREPDADESLTERGNERTT